MLLEPENHFVGTVNEDFAVECLAGDIFQLGNKSYRIQRVERGIVRVEDAHGMAPTIPFWLGEAPGRSDELSASVSQLRTHMAALLGRDPSGQAALRWRIDECAMDPAAAEQLVEYLAAGHAALCCLPTQDNIVLERFFDEAGGMQLIVHSPYGSRINRAWGLALRKRFCRKFNFELQAAATEDNIVISLTQAHSFALEEVARYLHSNSVRTVLTQALLDSPMFTTRWRWVIGVALALPRFRGGKKVPPQLARMGAEDLIGAVFPDQIACAENLAGEREIPDHPLVRQAIGDSLTEAMDIDGLERLLRGIESGAVRITVRDLTQPSPLALEVLSARPYAYLDDAPLEERRTQAVMARRWMSPQQASDLGRLDPEAIARVRSEAWPEAENADELHDALVWLGFLTSAEVASNPRWSDWLVELAAQKRATHFDVGGSTLWIAAERLPHFRALWPKLKTAPALAVPSPYHKRADARMAGPKALDRVVAQLEGFEAPAGAWESEILAARLADYEPDWLDERCLAGHIAWMRLRPRNGRTNGEGRPAPVRTTPITLLPRRHASIWTSLSPHDAAAHPSPRAQLLADCIKEHGASFFDELMDISGLLRSQVEEALAELVALGLVTSDSFGGLRALLVPSSERRTGANGRRRRRTASFGMENAGRWAMVRRSAAAERNGVAIEHVARTLLARYGVVFWRLLEREAAWLPPWRELLRFYRRLESRGEVRGGRFVAGFSGEQFALPEAIGMLRATRRQDVTDQWVSVSGADPLNLVGILTPGAKLPALAGNRLLYRDGIPTAVLAAGDTQFLETLDNAREWTAQKALLRGPVHAASILPNADEQVSRRENAGNAVLDRKRIQA